MNLIEKISNDMKTAIKTGEKIRLETLRMVKAQLLEKQVEKRNVGGLTIDDEISVLLSASKKRKEAIESYKSSGRLDLAKQEEIELAIIQEYLPKQLTKQEIEEYISRAISELGASSPKDFGRVMGKVMRDLKGKADGKIIQETVKRILGE